MRDSSATEKTRLLNPWAMLIVLSAVGGLLWMTFQSEDVFRPDGRQPDQVSANYAELLLAAHPESDQLRTQLIDLLIQLGDYPRAKVHVDEWTKPQDPAMRDYYAVELDALTALGNPDPNVLKAVVERLKNFDSRPLPLPQLEGLAKLELSIQAPGLAAHVFEELAKRDPAQREKWLSSAAQWYLASEQPSRAADIYLQLQHGTDSPELRHHYMQQAFKSLLAASRSRDAVSLLSAELDAAPNSPLEPELLEAGVDAAVAEKRVDLAERFFLAWRKSQPESPEVLAKELQLRLAFGDLDGAWFVGQQLLVLHPDDPKLLEQMAHVGEWKGDNAAALTMWIKLLEQRDDPKMHEHAWRLALQLFDFDRGIPLLVSLGDSRALHDDELDALVYAHESRGTPHQAEAWLRTYVRKHPGHRLAWTRLLQNLENTEQFAAKAVVWESMSKQFTLTSAERVDWANTYLKLFNPQNAWQVMDVDTRTIQDPEYWRIRAELAWELERDDELREALEKMLAIKGSLSSGDESQLVTLYRVRDPHRALQLTIDGWHRRHDPARLIEALQMALDLQDWNAVKSLLAEADALPDADQRAQTLAGHGAVAMHDGDVAAAEGFYLAGIERFPHSNVFRERLLWLYIDQNKVAELKPLLTEWKPIARGDSLLWLPFASAAQMTGRNAEALAWYRLYLSAKPDDWLVQAAYADALETAEYFESAQRLRVQLLRDLKNDKAPVSPQRYAVWLRLLASSYSPRVAQHKAMQWQDGSPAMLQLWFEQLMARLDTTNQESQKNDWLTWARGHGVRIERYEEIQEALRNHNKDMLQQLLAKGDLNPAQQVEALNLLGRGGEALGVAVTSLSDDQPPAVREQLRRQAVEMYERTPQGAQIAWNKQDFGGLDFDATRLNLARNIGNDWYASMVLEQGHYRSDLVVASRLGDERNLELTLQHPAEKGSYKLIVDTSQRKDHDRNGLGISRTWNLTDRDDLDVGLDWHRKSEESGLMRVLGQESSVWFAGRRRFTARDQVSWGFAQKAFSTRDDESLGNGQALKFEYDHTLEFEGPNWMLRSGLDYQHNNLNGRSLGKYSNTQGGPINLSAFKTIDANSIGTDDLLQSRYGQMYVGSSWRRGFPGALNRTRPQYTWLLDTTAGYQWMDKTFNYGVTTGLGMEVLGGDELAFTFGYQSAPQGGDGKAGGVLGISYGLRFGR